MIAWQLFGPNAVGKTTLGSWLAPQLQLEFVDLDQLMQQTFAVDELAACVSYWGAEGFHKRSLACLQTLAQSRQTYLVAVGSGSQWANQGRPDLLQYPSLYLWSEPRWLWQRNRELRQDPRSLEAFMAVEYSPEREYLYHAATLRIDLSHLSLSQAQQQILQVILENPPA